MYSSDEDGRSSFRFLESTSGATVGSSRARWWTNASAIELENTLSESLFLVEERLAIGGVELERSADRCLSGLRMQERVFCTSALHPNHTKGCTSVCAGMAAERLQGLTCRTV